VFKRFNKVSVFRIVLITALALMLAVVPAAFAAKGGNGSGGQGGAGGTGSSATLTLSPNPVSSWSPFWGSGCGYTVGQQVNIVVNSPYWNAGFPVGVDASGCIQFQFWVDGPGTYGVKAMQGTKKQTVLASASLEVL
jgi:hypothetical protein